MLWFAKAIWRPETQGQLGVFRRVQFAARMFQDVVTYITKPKEAPPLRVMPRAWRRGFTAGSYLMYELDHHDHRSFLPDTAPYVRRVVEGPLSRILGDKLAFSAVVGAHVKVPAVLALITRGRLFAADCASGITDVASLLAFCEQGDGVIIKPTTGMGGRDVHCLAVESSHPMLNGRQVTIEDVQRLLAGFDDYLVTRRVHQADYAARIFPDAANTIRIVTMQDPADQHRPFILVAVHRFGVRASAPTDNASRGGLVATIDLATGRLGLASNQHQHGDKTFAVHPETGAQIEGLEVPRWEACQREILRVAERLDFLKFVGWDVLNTDEGIVVIEGNLTNRSIQRRQPYLADPRARRFFEHHGVV